MGQHHRHELACVALPTPQSPQTPPSLEAAGPSGPYLTCPPADIHYTDPESSEAAFYEGFVKQFGPGSAKNLFNVRPEKLLCCAATGRVL